jgi:F-type H+-transporting ATPase subunit epsilon
VSEEKSSSTLNLKVLTPDGPVLEGEVYEVSIPGTLGEMGIFPQHAALLTGIVPGKLSYRAPEATTPPPWVAASPRFRTTRSGFS